MFCKVKVIGPRLIVARTLLSERKIDLRDVRSVEVYGNSVIPPLVTSTLLASQLIIFLGLRGIDILNNIIERESCLVLFISNILLFTSLSLTYVRARLVTLKVTFLKPHKPLTIHFVPRSTCDKIIGSLRGDSKLYPPDGP